MTIGINASFLRKLDTGIGQVTRNFLEKLRDLNDENDTNKIKFILYLEEDVDFDLQENFEKRIFLPKFYKRDDLIRKVIWEKNLLPREVEKDGCDVLFSMYQSATVLKTKHIMLVHDAVWKVFPQYLNNSRKKIYARLVEKGIKKADEIITVSEHSKKDIEKYFNVSEEKITVNYIDCDEVFKNDLNTSHDKILNQVSVSSADGQNDSYIFYVGGFDKRKNVGKLIEAYGRLSKKYENISEMPDLVLAGKFHSHLVPLVTDIPKKIKGVCEKYGLPKEKIIQLGFAPQKDLPALYKNAKLFCYPSSYEGFGLPVLEAMNSGVPIVCGNNSSIPEVCSEDSAILTDTDNANEISEAMYDLLTSPELAQEKVKNAKEEAKKFSWEKFTKKLLNLIIQNVEK